MEEETPLETKKDRLFVFFFKMQALHILLFGEDMNF